MFQNKNKFDYETKPNNKFETNPFALYIFLKQINYRTFICKKTEKVYEWNVK